jgi:hypothetical protein
MIAERIARRVAADTTATSSPMNDNSAVTAEITAVHANICELQKKLAQLEAKLTNRYSTQQASPKSSPFPAQPLTPTPAVPFTHSPWLAGVNAVPAHAAEERFGVEEATINELVDFFQNEKMCSLDPSGKPCDHCAMCSSRGF